MRTQDLIELIRLSKKISEINCHKEEMVMFIPKLSVMLDYDQQNYAHQYDLWAHSLHTALGLPKDIDDDMLYLAALFHDIGKPYCRTEDIKDGRTNMHYYGHPEISAEIVKNEIMPLLTLTEDEQRRLLYYVRYHDDRVSLREKHLKRHIKIGASLQEFQNLMKLQVADAKAHIIIPIIQDRIVICTQWAGSYGSETYARIQNISNKNKDYDR